MATFVLSCKSSFYLLLNKALASLKDLQLSSLQLKLNLLISERKQHVFLFVLFLKIESGKIVENMVCSLICRFTMEYLLKS